MVTYMVHPNNYNQECITSESHLLYTLATIKAQDEEQNYVWNVQIDVW